MTQSFVIYTDGGSRGNPGKAASAAVVYDDAGNVRLKCGKYLGIATNNVAEYTAVIVALEELIKVLGKDSTSSILSFLQIQILSSANFQENTV